MENETKPTSLFETIKRDAEHLLFGPWFAPQPVEWNLIRFLRLLITPNFLLVFRYRIYNYLHYKGITWLAYYLYVRTIKNYACDISPEAQIGGGLRIEHCSDVIIGPQARLGTDNAIFNGVTLGKRLRGGDEADGMPQLGDRVLVGTGAKLLGRIEIGTEAKIGANSVVLQSVPPGRSAVGSPARILNNAAAQAELSGSDIIGSKSKTA